MGLKGYIGDGVYCMIDGVQYDKRAKFIKFDLFIYKNVEKTRLLANKNFTLHLTSTCPGVKQIGIMSLPLSPENGDAYIISKDATDIFSEYRATRAVYEGGEWRYWNTTTQELLYDLEKDIYVRYNRLTDGVTIEHDPNDLRIWDRFFCAEKIEQNGIITQCYTYLKSLPEFAGTTDV